MLTSIAGKFPLHTEMETVLSYTQDDLSNKLIGPLIRRKVLSFEDALVLWCHFNKVNSIDVQCTDIEFMDRCLGVDPAEGLSTVNPAFFATSLRHAATRNDGQGVRRRYGNHFAVIGEPS